MVSPPQREPSSRASAREAEAVRSALLRWFEDHGPDYPWRRLENDPYAVLVSEVMLQQTQASRVVEAFPRFLARFPTVEQLAAASRAEVVRAWAGMGYHRRAVALHETARVVMGEHGGRVPSDPATLRTLPGIGPYTAAAVASIAFSVPTPAVDTNVRKVMARVDHGAERDEITGGQAAQSAESWLDRAHPGDWNQALMTMGRRICRTTPRCEICPFAPVCRFRASGRVGRPSAGRQPAFEGSMRQVRGAVVAALRTHPSLSLGRLAALTGQPLERVAAAVTGLVSDGVASAGPAALAGGSGGRVRLATC
jgi:A/G-specific adenine glycosylase